MTFEEFEKATDITLKSAAKECFDIAGHPQTDDTYQVAKLVEAQFYMQELDRRDATIQIRLYLAPSELELSASAKLVEVTGVPPASEYRPVERRTGNQLAANPAQQAPVIAIRKPAVEKQRAVKSVPATQKANRQLDAQTTCTPE